MQAGELFLSTRRAVLAGLVVLAAGVAAVVLYASPAAAAPPRPDLAVRFMTASPTFPQVGEGVDIDVAIRNFGTATTSSAVTVRVALPPGLDPAHGDVGGDWACTFAAPDWVCTHAALAPGETAEVVVGATVASSATPDDVLTIVGTVVPDRKERDTTGNTDQVSVTVAGTATIHGTAWIDVNKDGQRQPGEPGMPVGPSALVQVSIVGRNGSLGTQATLDADGTYTATVPSGTYMIQFEIDDSTRYGFTTADVGDDATDSDVISAQGGGNVIVGQTTDFVVGDGDSVAYDAGVIDRSLG